MQREIPLGGGGRIPDRQRIKGLPDGVAQVRRRLPVAMPLSGELEFPQRFLIYIKGIRLRGIVEPHADGPVLIGRVGHLEELGFFGDVRHPEAAILDIAIELIRIRRAAPVAAVPPSCKRPDTGAPLVRYDVVCIVLVGRRPVLIDESGQTEPCTQIDQGRLKPAHIPIWRDYRPSNRIRDGFGLTNRTVQQRNAIVTLQIGRVGQNEIGEGHHFRQNRRRNR